MTLALNEVQHIRGQSVFFSDKQAMRRTVVFNQGRPGNALGGSPARRVNWDGFVGSAVNEQDRRESAIAL